MYGHAAARNTIIRTMLNAPVLDEATVRDIARKADVDERSVIKRLAGLPVKGRAGARIEAVLAALLEPPRARERAAR